MINERIILPREIVRYIRKSSRKWEDSEIKDLVTLLINSHEELRRKADEAEQWIDFYRRRRKRRRR